MKVKCETHGWELERCLDYGWKCKPEVEDKKIVQNDYIFIDEFKDCVFVRFDEFVIVRFQKTVDGGFAEKKKVTIKISDAIDILKRELDKSLDPIGKVNECLHCGHKWINRPVTRRTAPALCPKCKSPKWRFRKNK